MRALKRQLISFRCEHMYYNKRYQFGYNFKAMHIESKTDEIYVTLTNSWYVPIFLNKNFQSSQVTEGIQTSPLFVNFTSQYHNII